MLRTSVLVAILVQCASAALAQSPRLFGELEAGPYAVGFRVIALTDPSRPSGPKLDANGRPADGDRARRLAIHVWYPAAASRGDGMAMREYIVASEHPPQRRGSRAA